MRSISVAGDYQILGRCNDIDGNQVLAAKRTSDRKAEQLFALHHFQVASETVEKELRALSEASRGLDNPFLVTPREILRTPEGLFVVTDFVPGETLDAFARNEKALMPKMLAVATVRELARAVFEAREKLPRSLVGDISSNQIVVAYETGQLKVFAVGSSLFRGKSPMPASKTLGLVLWELLTGRKPYGDVGAPKSGADLDRIVVKALSATPMTDDLHELAEQLHRYTQSYSTGVDVPVELQKLIRQHYSHKAAAMRALIERWRTQVGAIPARRPTSVPAIPRPSSVSGARPRRTSSITPAIERRAKEAAFAEAVDDLVILAPEEFVPTEDMRTADLRPPRRKYWPRARLAFLGALFMLSLASAALVAVNGDVDALLATWRSIIASAGHLR